MNSFQQGYQRGVIQNQQRALEAQRQAEIKRKQEEALKKKEAQEWINDFQADTININAKTNTLKQYNPVYPNINKGFGVPPLTDQSNPYENTNKPVYKIKSKPKEKPLHDKSEFTGSKLNEGELRDMYYSSDREIIKCMNGTKECSPERVKALEVRRMTAESGLAVHFNYREVNGNFIKDPNANTYR